MIAREFQAQIVDNFRQNWLKETAKEINMKRNRTSLKKILKKAHANEWQQGAAFILLRVNGIDNAFEYASGINCNITSCLSRPQKRAAEL